MRRSEGKRKSVLFEALKDAQYSWRVGCEGEMEKEETGAVIRDRMERIIRSLDFIQKGIGGPGKGLRVIWCVF